MGVKLYDVYTGGTDWFLNSPVVKNVFSNPINTAIIIVLVMVLIVAFYYKDYDGDDRYGKLFRVGLYGGLFTLTAVFIHNTLLLKEHTKRDELENEKIIFAEQLHPDQKSVNIKPENAQGRGERSFKLDDIPDIQTQSSDESDILAPRKSLKIEDLI